MAGYITPYFPNVNPVVFDKPGTYHNWKDAARHIPAHCYIQKYALNDRLTFQVRIIDQLDRFYLNRAYILTLNRIDLRTGTRTAVYTEQKDVDGIYHVFSVTRRISEIITNTNEFYLELELRLIDTSLGLTVKRMSYESNTLQLITDTGALKDTKLIKYTNSTDRYDALFSEMPAGFEIRLPALFGDPMPGQNSNIFESYQRDLQLISATPYENINLYIGQNNIGIPDWHLKNINAILSCDYKSIDRVQYELLPEADLTPVRADNYLFGWLNILVAKAKNEFSQIFQEPYGDSPISITSTVNASSGAGTYEITVDSTGDFYLESNSNFFTFSPTFGYAGSTVITVTVDENFNTSSRSGQITAYLEENPSVFAISNIIQVGQRILHVSPESLTLPYANGREATFNITSNHAWTLDYDPDVVTPDITAGTGNAIITVTGEQYYGRGPRNTTITVVDTGSDVSIPIPAQLEGTPSFIDLDNPSPIYVDSDVTRVDITGESNGYVMSFRVISGNGTVDANYIINGNITVPDNNAIPGDPGMTGKFTFSSGITFPANETSDEVNRVVKIYSGRAELDLTIIQRAPGEVPSLDVNPTSLSFEWEPEAPKIVQVTSNINSSIINASDFLVIDPLSGSGNWSHNVIALPRTGRNPRNGSYTIQSEGGGLSKVVAVNQSGKSAFARADERTYYVYGFEGDEITLKVTGKGNFDYFFFASEDGDYEQSDFIRIPPTFLLNGNVIDNRDGEIFPGDPGATEEYTWEIDLIIPRYDGTESIRYGEVYLWEDRGYFGFIRIAQYSDPAYINVNPDLLEMSANGMGGFSIVDTNTTWEIVEAVKEGAEGYTAAVYWDNGDIIRLTYTEERGISQLIAGTVANPGAMRELSLTLRSTDGTVEKALTIRQEAVPVLDYEIYRYSDLLDLRTAIINRTESNLIPQATNGGGFAGFTIGLANNIDFQNRAFPGIGSYSSASIYSAFRGTFDGNGYSLLNFNVAEPTGNNIRGLFIALEDAEVRNLTIRGDINYPNATARIGLISPFIVGNCKFSKIVNYCDVTAGYWASWVYNENQGANRLIEAADCINFGNFSCVNSLSPYMVTMFGGATTVSVIATRCVNFGDMSVPYNATSGRCAGIAVGQFLNIDSCYNAGRINSSNVSNQNTFACGIAGYHEHVAGGSASIINCYDLGKIAANENRMGLITKGSAAITYQNNYYNSDILEPTSGYDGEPKTTEELKSGHLFNSPGFFESPREYPVIAFEMEAQYRALNQ